jgi:hypothetical protein
MPRGYISQTKHNEIVNEVNNNYRNDVELALSTLEMSKSLIEEGEKRIANLKTLCRVMVAVCVIDWMLAIWFAFN